MTTAPICFLDTETDGVHPGRKVWEVAAIRREPDGTETEWSAFVAIELSTADPFGLRVGRFHDRHPLGRYLSGLDIDQDYPGRTPAYATAHDAAYQVARFTHGAHIFGCVPGFDTGCLAPMLRAAGLSPAWHYQPQDIESWIAGYLCGQGKPVDLPLSSEALSREIGVEPPGDDERHTALGDARWVARMYDAVMTGGA